MIKVSSKSISLSSGITFIILWHFFFASSFVLRLNPQIFWPLVFIAAIVIALYNRVQIGGAELEILIFSFLGFIFCFIAAEPWEAIGNQLYFFIYFCVAAMIARFTKGETIRKQILFFCVIHLICIYVQVFLPGVYENTILQLLPSYAHSDILYQMKYNSSYYGFTVQTSITAMYMTFGVIVAAVNAKHEDKKLNKIIDVALILLFITGILFVTRRGSFFAILLILAYIYFDTSKSKMSRVVLILVGIIFLIYFGIDKIPGMQGMIDKFNRLSGNISNGRQNILRIALSNLWNYPLFGYGVGRANVTGGGGSVDNAYVAILVERGIIGTIIFFTPYLHLLIQSFSRKKMSKIKMSKIKMKSVEISFYFQLLFVIISFVENYYGQALTMFIYYMIVLSEQYDTQRITKNENIASEGGKGYGKNSIKTLEKDYKYYYFMI